VAFPSTPELTDVPIALAASAWVTTEQELKFAEVAAVVVVAACAPVVELRAVEVVVDEVGDDPHPVSNMATNPITRVAGRPSRSPTGLLIWLSNDLGQKRISLLRAVLELKLERPSLEFRPGRAGPITGSGHERDSRTMPA